MLRVLTEEAGRDDARMLLDEIVARRMLAAALEAEVDTYVSALADEVDDRGHRLVVRNGHAVPRPIATGAGPIVVAARGQRPPRRRGNRRTAAVHELDPHAVVPQVAEGVRGVAFDVPARDELGRLRLCPVGVFRLEPRALRPFWWFSGHRPLATPQGAVFDAEHRHQRRYRDDDAAAEFDRRDGANPHEFVAVAPRDAEEPAGFLDRDNERLVHGVMPPTGERETTSGPLKDDGAESDWSEPAGRTRPSNEVQDSRGFALPTDGPASSSIVTRNPRQRRICRLNGWPIGGDAVPTLGAGRYVTRGAPGLIV